jgi:hypothetical protein
MYDQILVAGNGKTSRANVEALIDDYIHANPKVVIHLYSTDRLSEGQVWLKQYLEEKEIEHHTKLGSLEVPKGKTAMFILWDDEDNDSLIALSAAKETDTPAFDLTNGLVALVPPSDLPKVEASKMPVQEMLPVDEAVVTPDSDDEEDDEDSDYEDPLYEAIQIIAEIFAESIARELKKVLKK